MIRFMLRLVGALLVEEICERIRPVPFPLAPLGKPDGWLRYYGPAVTGIKGPTLFSKPLFEGDYMVGASGTTPAGVDVSTSLYEGWTPTRAGPTTIHFTSTDSDPYWKDE